MGDRPTSGPVPTQDRTKYTEVHPCPERNSNQRYQCSSVPNMYGLCDRLSDDCLLGCCAVWSGRN
jgi:hypothetical protein